MPWKDPEKAREYQKEYQAKYHQDHKAERLAEIYRRKAEVYWYIQNIKNTWACEDCGIRHPAVLQFHHRRKEDKVFNIGDACRRKLSLERVKQEVAKCMIICANCHFIRHWNERHETSNLATQLEQAKRYLIPSQGEQNAYEKVFGTSGDPDQEYRDSQEYFGVDPRNRR